jgi:outer membrane receptor protein involved in Fe transport
MRTLAIAALAAAAALHAQTVTGSIEGVVQDATGGAIAGAKLTLRSGESGLTRNALSNPQGFYQFSFVPIGDYTVTAEAAGFGAVQRAVPVSLNTTRVADFRLSPAAVSTQVTVEAETSLIEMSRGEQKSSLDEKAIEDRPLSSRNMLALVEMMPGFQSSGSFSGVNNPTLSSGSYVSFNGTGSRSASFQIDGVNNDDSSEGISRQNVNVSSIKEFVVLTNAFSAEFGRGGTAVLVQTKSGTNKIHGDAYEFLQNQVLNSNGFFNKTAGRRPDGSEVIPRAPYRRNQFGYTAGLPIVKNKLFLFHAFERTEQRAHSTITRFVFPAGTRIQVGDCRLCLNPDDHPNLEADKKLLESILARFPAEGPNNPAFCANCFTKQVASSFPDQDYSGKLDYNRSSRDYYALRYQYSRQKRRPGQIIDGEAAFQNNRQQNVGLTATHIFSPNTSGEFRFGLGLRTTLVDISSGNDTPIVRISNPSAFTTTTMGSAGAFPINRFQTDFQFNYNLSHIRGRHSLRMGVDFRRSRLDDLADNNSRGFYNFTATGIRGAPTFYEGFENFLRGYIPSYQKGYGNFFTENRMGEWNQYIQDDWKLRPNLVLNLGYRYEFVERPTEINNRVDYAYGNFTRGHQPRFGIAWTPRPQSGLLRKLTGGPERTSLRGGFGLFHTRIFQSVFSQSGASLRSLPPYGILRSFDATFNVADPSGGYVYSPQNFNPTGIALARIAPDLGMPNIQQFNFTIDRMIGNDIVLSLGYNRTRGIGLIQNASLNRARFPFLGSDGVYYDKIDPDLGNTRPNPGFISIAQPRTNLRRPDPRYAGITYIHNGSWSYYNALRLSLRQRYRKGLHWMVNYSWSKSIDTGSDVTQGVTVFELDSASSLRGLSDFHQAHRININYGYLLPFFAKAKGPANWILGGWTLSGNHTYATGNPFTVTAGYDVNADGVANDRPVLLTQSLYGRSIDNGRINPQTGRQYSEEAFPLSGFFPTASTPVSQRPFDPGGSGAGTIGRNIFFGAGLKNWDLALAKNFKGLAEGHRLSFRGEFYNLFNSPRFALPVRNTLSPTFGRITSAYNPFNFVGASRLDDTARMLQFSLRYVF